MRNKWKPWLFIGAGVLVLLTAALLASTRQPDSFSPYVSQSPSPSGVKAMYEYIEQERQVSRWNGSPERLPNLTASRQLIMVEPSYTLTGEEMRRYEKFMEKGHTILLLKKNPVGYFDLKIDPTPPSEGPVEVTGSFENSLEATVGQSFRLRPQAEDQVLMEDEKGALVLERSYGEGQLIVSMNPDWVINGAILEHDHAALTAQLLKESGSGPILVDEYIHGPKNIPTVFTIYPKWVLVIALQLILLAIVWLWKQGKRFGPIYTPREHLVRLGDERLQALSSWYIRGGFYKESIQIQEQYLRSLIQKRWGLSRASTWPEIREALAKYQTADEQDRWKRYTTHLDDIDTNDKLRKSSYLQYSRNIDDLRKEVQER